MARRVVLLIDAVIVGAGWLVGVVVAARILRAVWS